MEACKPKPHYAWGLTDLHFLSQSEEGGRSLSILPRVILFAVADRPLPFLPWSLGQHGKVLLTWQFPHEGEMPGTEQRLLFMHATHLPSDLFYLVGGRSDRKNSGWASGHRFEACSLGITYLPSSQAGSGWVTIQHSTTVPWLETQAFQKPKMWTAFQK